MITIPLPADHPCLVEAARAAGHGDDVQGYCLHVLVRSLYDLGALSSGRAAEMLGMPRVAFLEAYGLSAASIRSQAEEILDAAVERLDGEEPPTAP